jgi:DUF3071 family protein
VATKGNGKAEAKTNGNGHSAVRLKAVGVSDDGLSLILATRANARAGPYRLLLDESLLAQLEEARTRVAAAREAQAAAALEADPPEAAPAAEVPPPQPVRVESKLTVKEVQSLLRQGRSVQSIAKKAGVSESWIERFEVPIVWERAGMAARAQRATLVKSRSGASALPLGEAVQSNLKSRRIAMTPDAYSAAWDSTRHPKTGKWTVTFTFTSRRRPHIAQWQYDTENLEVHPLNKLAAELGWVQPRRRRAAASASA